MWIGFLGDCRSLMTFRPTEAHPSPHWLCLVPSSLVRKMPAIFWSNKLDFIQVGMWESSPRGLMVRGRSCHHVYRTVITVMRDFS